MQKTTTTCHQRYISANLLSKYWRQPMKNPYRLTTNHNNCINTSCLRNDWHLSVIAQLSISIYRHSRSCPYLNVRTVRGRYDLWLELLLRLLPQKSLRQMLLRGVVGLRSWWNIQLFFDANLTGCARSTLLLAHRHAGVQQCLHSCMVLDGQREIPCCWQLPQNRQRQTPRHSCWWSTGGTPGPRWLWPGSERALAEGYGDPSKLQIAPYCTRYG